MATLILAFTTSCSESKKDTKKSSKDKAEKKASTPEDKDTANTAFQTLDILPEGSILRSVRFPSYDEDFTPLSLFSADKLTVLNGHQIEAEGISMEMYGKDGNVKQPTTIKMSRAIYTQKHDGQKHSILKASEAILIKGPTKDKDSEPSFIASGTGLILDLDTKRGFLLGPAASLFQIRQSDTKPKPDSENKANPSQ